MKVLIIGIPRSGTTNLARYFNIALNYQAHIEPWNIDLRKPQGTLYPYPFELEKNCVVKTIVHQLPESIHTDYKEFYREAIKEYDLVILLSRKDREAVLMSFTYHKERMFEDVRAKRSYSWHLPYHIEDESLVPIEKRRSEAENFFRIFDEVKDDLNIKVTWYEDLYSGNESKVKEIIKDWGEEHTYEKIIEFVHPSKRYKRKKSTL